MVLLKQLLNFYINSSIHVALSVFSLSWITLIEHQIPYDKNVLFFVFFATITGYNFVKYFGIAKFHHRRLASWLKMIQIFSFFSFLLLFFFAFKLEQTTLYYIAVFGVITFLYAIPFLPKQFFLDSQQNLRSIGGLKIYVTALVWTGVTVFLPIINNNLPIINLDVILSGIQRYIFVIVLMFPFEIRDLQYDSLKLSTVPQKIGVMPTKITGVILLAGFFYLEFFKNNIYAQGIFPLAFITIITLLFLLFSNTKQGNYYSSFWVEGLPVLWLIAILINA